jgi:hypothetical protein
MRLLQILFLVQVISTVTYGQDRSFIVGETQDCFAGKLIHPAQVDIYLLDPRKSPEIAGILNEMEGQVPKRDDQSVDALFASYQRLTAEVKKASKLRHVRPDDAGRFSFHGLKEKTNVMLLGIAEREDEPAYYAYVPLKVGLGENLATLDFDRGNACQSH